MRLSLKPIEQQVMVITGATSGIGLVTARMAARLGAKLVLAARNEAALRELAEEINKAGGQAISVTADVGREDDVRQVSQAAVERFGGFDTWVNNAGVSVYARLTQMTFEDHRRLFDTNYWGVVYGSIVAAQHLRDKGGAIINVGSVLSETVIPLQAAYSASKHAVKGFTDGLRIELRKDAAPISVTLIKPAAIDTPYTRHAKNYLPNEPMNPPPVYVPETVAEGIIHCAQHPTESLVIGGGGKALTLLGRLAPRLRDRLMGATMFGAQQSDRPVDDRVENSLHRPSRDLDERGGYPGHVMESSMYTKASMHPVLTGALVVGAGLAVAALLSSRED